MGANVKEFLHLVEEFVNMVGLQMSGFQDIYEVTENLGEPPHPPDPNPTPPQPSPPICSHQAHRCDEIIHFQQQPVKSREVRYYRLITALKIK